MLTGDPDRACGARRLRSGPERPPRRRCARRPGGQRALPRPRTGRTAARDRSTSAPISTPSGSRSSSACAVEPVFSGERVGEVLKQQMTAAPPRLDPPVPRTLVHIVDRLVRRDPAERYQLADALLHDLDQLIEARSRPAWPIRPSCSAPGTVARRWPSRPSSGARTSSPARGPAGPGRGRSGRHRPASVPSPVAARAACSRSSPAGRPSHVRQLHGQGLDQAAQRPFQVLSGVARDVVRAAAEDEAFGRPPAPPPRFPRADRGRGLPRAGPLLGVEGVSALGPGRVRRGADRARPVRPARCPGHGDRPRARGAGRLPVGRRAERSAPRPLEPVSDVARATC